MINLLNKGRLHLISVYVVLMAITLTGCAVSPPLSYSTYSDTKDWFKPDVNQLIGRNRAYIEGVLGHPTSRIRFYDSMIYVYVQGHSKFFCSYLKFDANDRLVGLSRKGLYSPNIHSPRKWCQHWFRSSGYTYDPWINIDHRPYDPNNVPVPVDYYECDYNEEQKRRAKPVYWKSVNLWSDNVDELTAAASSGNPEARLQLYWNDMNDGLYSLCLAANQGHPKASYRVAQLYEFGDDGIGKDLKLAYLWYDLAAKACHPWAKKDALRILRDSLNEDERRATKKMIENWSPIECKSWK